MIDNRSIWWWLKWAAWTGEGVTASLALILGLAGALDWGVPYPCSCPSLVAFHFRMTPALFSISITVLIIGTSSRVRERNRLRAQLIREMGSTDNGIALRAVEAIRGEGWLEDGSLIDANLENANLQDVSLVEANLRRAILARARLQGGLLQGLDLREASLDEADLQRARIRVADLQQASLERANLRQAILVAVHLQAASLQEVDLQGARLESVEFDESTILPDGTSWAPETEIGRFTNPEHPDFWRSSDVFSPAHFPAE